MAEPAGAQTVRSVERAFDILDALERTAEPMRLVDISRTTGLHTATALRLLAVLQHRGFVDAAGGVYRVGSSALGTAHSYLRTSPLVASARPHLQELAVATGLTTSLYVRNGDERLLIARVDGAHPLRYQLPLGQRLPLDVGAGRPILAFLSDDEREAHLLAARDAHDAAGRSLTVDDLRASVVGIRANGFHVSTSERAVGVIAVSVPVLGADGAVIGSLSASGPAELNTPEELITLVPEMQRAAHAIGHS